MSVKAVSTGGGVDVGSAPGSGDEQAQEITMIRPKTTMPHRAAPE
jgi:hypothetical protein